MNLFALRKSTIRRNSYYYYLVTTLIIEDTRMVQEII